MKKFWIMFMVILGLIGVGIFSSSFGNEEMQKLEPNYPYTLRKSDSRIFENTYRT